MIVLSLLGVQSLLVGVSSLSSIYSSSSSSTSLSSSLSRVLPIVHPPTIPPDTGGFDPTICMPTSSGPPAVCTWIEAYRAVPVVLGFQTCSGWSATELAVALVNSAAVFEDVAMKCSGSIPTPPDGEGGGGGGGGGGGDGTIPPVTPPTDECMTALQEMADTHNPMARYVKDLFTNPTKYCKCNDSFGSDLPSCKLDSPNLTVDLTKMKQVSCLFNEVCDEITNTCAMLVDAIKTCLDNSGVAAAIAAGTTIDKCDLDCGAVMPPQTCLSPDPPPHWLEVKSELDIYYAACEKTDEETDYGDCMALAPDIGGAPPATCSLDLALGSTIMVFVQCTNWDPSKIAADFAASELPFEEILAPCAMPDNMNACFLALHKESKNNDPMSKYIKAMYENTDKYCGCNADLFKGLPEPCSFRFSGKSLDLGQVKFSTCLFGELCADLERACDTLAASLQHCLPNKTTYKANECASVKADCLAQGVSEDMLTTTSFPPGCKSGMLPPLHNRVRHFEVTCLNMVDTGPVDDGGSKDDTDDGTAGETAGETKKVKFPAGVGVAIAFVLVGGLGFVAYQKVLKRRQHPGMGEFATVGFDNDDDDEQFETATKKKGPKKSRIVMQTFESDSEAAAAAASSQSGGGVASETVFNAVHAHAPPPSLKASGPIKPLAKKERPLPVEDHPVTAVVVGGVDADTFTALSVSEVDVEEEDGVEDDFAAFRQLGKKGEREFVL